MSVNRINDYLQSLETVSTLINQSQVSPQTQEIAGGAEDSDSYISTVKDASAPLPCETYNDILSKIAASDSAFKDSSSTEYESDSSENVSGTPGSSGQKDADEDGTKTKIVVINGISYLETTTTKNGIETVTRVPVSSEGSTQDEEKDTGKKTEPSIVTL